ncbi:Uncharacterised protein [Legionella busanensis]|uniref:DUF6671 domain-containing protein n=1 Tax=Legionella busanensis TaxID=190655 RepID=A0A378KDJ5_9GAMM|nr:DUF6671 family protein [Legionella busanensis]STX81292.1 Uncharacterised protein [Legionella busanensis]
MLYRNEPVLLVSKHKKEQAIGPVFQDKIGCELCVSDFDTDLFGTFTGEIPRAHNAYQTCILKAKTAALIADYVYSLASEGSFGPHPSLPFVASDHEIMVFVDLKNDWIIADQLITPRTNYKTLTLNPSTEIDSFLHAVHFPSHAVTLQVNQSKEILGKGIQDRSFLSNLIKLGFTKGEELLIATDMRAMMNPTRMAVLVTLAEKLATRILTYCSVCKAPGFGFVSTTEYLLCSLCDAPTSLYRFELWGCVACEHQEKKPRADNVKKANPTFCNDCNP